MDKQQLENSDNPTHKPTIFFFDKWSRNILGYILQKGKEIIPLADASTHLTFTYSHVYGHTLLFEFVIYI